MKRVDMACYRELVPYITKDPCGTVYPLSIVRSRKNIDELDSFGQYYDGKAFTHILSVKICKNEKLQRANPKFCVNEK